MVDVNGQVGAEVQYLGKPEQFTATQIVSMFRPPVCQAVCTWLLR